VRGGWNENIFLQIFYGISIKLSLWAGLHINFDKVLG
jgi:hypothetical protein